MTDQEIDHEYTDEIVCPYCGHEFSDSWESLYGIEEAELECWECERPFKAYREVEVTYTTYKIEDSEKEVSE